MIYPLSATSQSIDIQIVDDTGLPVTSLVAATFPTLTYSLAGANADVAFPALSDLASLTTAWAAGGVKERGNGVYRLDLPNGVFTTAGEVKIRGEATGKHVIAPWIDVAVTVANLTNAPTAGDFTAAMKTSLNAATPALSAAGVQAIWDAATSALTAVGSIGKKLADWVIGTAQTGDSFAIVNSGSFGNSALLSAIQNVQNNTFIATSIPQMLEVPDLGSTVVSISVVFSDETGAAKNLDSGNPTLALVNDAGVDKSARLGAWSNPATGKYVISYTNTAGDALEGLHWDLSGTINSKLRRMVAYTQLVDTTAVDFTSSDRTNLNTAVTDLTSIVAKLPAGNIGDATAANQTTIINDVTSLGTPMQAGTAVQLATTQPNYAPAKAGDAMALTTAERSALSNALLDLADAVETGITLRQSHRAQLAALCGKLTTAGSNPEVYQNPAGTANRLSVANDASGNRSAVTLTL